MVEERVQKLIARTGLCSRREADALVAAGRVTVNGEVAVPGTKADPDTDHVKVDGKLLRRPQEKRYLVMYKPREVMTTCDDPEGRRTVIDLIAGLIKERVYPVGRLDYHSEGLLILTNDGDLAARIAHPRHGVVREYQVKIRGDLTPTELRRLMAGTVIDGEHVKPKTAARVRSSRDGASSWWRVEVTEGRTHEVRELFFRAGHHVQRLRRTAIGSVRDTTLAPGDLRELTAAEVAELMGRRAPRGDRRRPRKPPTRPKKG
jgi:23S rRNA pseudouridine2605 synthase